MIALNSINKFKTLNCQLPGIFLKGKKSREALPKRIAHSSNTSCPFYLLSLHSKKIYSSELHEQIHDFDLSIHFTFFLKRKKSREKLHNHIAQSLNTSRPFYLLSIRTKKNYSSEFHKQVHNFDLSNYFRFFLLLREMSRETVQKHVVQKPNTSRPFYLWLIRSKKIYSSEFHKQIHDFDPFTPSLHNQLSNFNQGYLEEKNCFLSISNWPMLYCNLKNWGGMFMSLKDKFFFFCICFFLLPWVVASMSCRIRADERDNL